MNPLTERLRGAGISPTRQRSEIARVLLARPVHMTAEQVLTAVREREPEVSRATVYNTLALFCAKGLLRELAVDRERVVYDSGLHPHHHLVDIDSGEVRDLPAGPWPAIDPAQLPAGFELAGVEVIVRVRRR